MSLYPFTAVVEQERLKQALLLNAVNPAVGGVLVEGPSGTAKSTAVRGLAELLPEIEVVADCAFSCEPARPCPACTRRAARGEQLETARRKVSVVDLPLNATEDRVAGSVDIARALREGIMALEPGLLADANRGILYVDEINLLDDHLCDVLLDAAALGVNTVEREGVSVSHPAAFLLVGTMNPDEGELRPQLADRIGLRVVVEALRDPVERSEVIIRREAFAADPEGFAETWQAAQEELAASISEARARVGHVVVEPGHYRTIARLVTGAGVQSHRADITVLQCAKAVAALDGRPAVEPDDLLEAAALALGHRVPLDPFDPVVGARRARPPPHARRRAGGGGDRKKSGGAGEAGRDVDLSELDAEPLPAGLDVEAGRVFEASRAPDRLERGAIGRRTRSLVSLPRGKYSRPRLARAHHRDVAFDATVRAAAVRAGRRASPFEVEPEDVRRKVREHRVPLEVCFVLDNSYSLHADRLVEKVKGVVFGLLEDATGRGDRASVVAFKSGVAEATVALRPTRSVAVAAERLRRVPLSGRTPLASALRLAGRLLRQELHKRPNAQPLVVVVSDGLPNVPLRRGSDPLADVLAEARALRRAGIACVVVDAVPAKWQAESCGRALADAAGGIHVPLADVSPAALVQVADEAAR